ncbi:hypothetical protein GGP62_003211 [Salinibacter ruber]|uniref:sulfotransferase family protein n=1 Tax=Salinibacter ruber TaxID=146919 RepID=UPI002168663D|nr:sulfotransferase [Salinibacter ruber]MCS3708301.1 hypothetical protein [Salinibacter ruber]
MLGQGWIRKGPKWWIKESRYLRYIRFLWFDTRLWRREPGTLPSFLILGAQRSGSTFLHDRLSADTSAQCSPLQKEVHYFDNKYYRSLEWYAKFFRSIEGGGVQNFETSPYYLYHPAAPRRVSESLPETKLLVVLRNPVERALSQFRWMREIGLETRDAVTAFRYDAERIGLEQDAEYLRQFEDPFHFDFDHHLRSYLRRSLYDVQLRRWLRRFDPSQIRVIPSRALFRRPEATIKEIASFLGVEYHGPNKKQKANRNASSRKIPVPEEARHIAERCLRRAGERTRAVVKDDMILKDAKDGLYWQV